MIIYFIAIAITLVLCRYKSADSVLPNGEHAQYFKDSKSTFLVLLPLVLVAVFRWDVGVDCEYGEGYWQAFQAAKDISNTRDFEKGFFYLTVILAKSGVSYWVYLSFISLLFMGFISYAINRGSIWASCSILVFFLLIVYFDSYNALRQTLAESLSLIAWANMCAESPSKRKDSHNILLFLLASTLHTTALINIPIYLICKIRFDQKNLLIFLILAIAMTPLLQVVFRTGMRYFAGDHYSFVGFSLINAAMTGFLFVCCWYSYNGICQINSYAYRYVNLSLCIFIVILNSGALLLPFRVFDMLKIGYIFIIPYILKSCRSSQSKFIMTTMMMCVIGAWFLNAFFIQENDYVYYETVFSDFWTRVTLP